MNILNFFPPIIFLRPWALWGLIFLPFILWLSLKNNFITNPWQAYCSPHLLNIFKYEVSSISTRLKPYLPAWIFFFGCLALAGPAWKYAPQILLQNQQALIVAVDLSEDMSNNDLLPDRITRAKFKILDLLKQYTGQVGLITFSSEAYVVAPLTSDLSTLNNWVFQLTPSIMPVQGYNLENALLKAESLISQGSASQQGTLVIFTAGDPSNADISQAKNLFMHGIKTYIILCQTASTLTSAQSANWLHFTQASGGVSFLIQNDDSDIKMLLSQIQTGKQIHRQKQDSFALKPVDEGPWFIILMLIGLIMLFRREVS